MTAFAVLVWTPARSASGWTRGMPPPRRARLSAPRVLAPRATLGENPVKPPAPAADLTDEASVDAYVRPGPAHPATGALDTLIGTFSDAADGPPGPAGHANGSAPRARRDVIARGRDQTLSVHGGERVRSPKITKTILDAIQVPVVQSATYTFRSSKDCIDYNRGSYQSFEYARYGNPTTRAVEEKIMSLDHAEDCLLSSSGMNAVTTMLIALVPENGHIVVTTDCYRRTRQFVSAVLPKMGITCTVLDPADMQGLKAVFASRAPTVYFSESPTNPLIRVVDVIEISKLCRQHGVISVIDTTFATPINFRPIDFGADLVLHSATKYLSGHQDVMCGALVGRADLIAKVRKLHGVLGGVIDPHAAYLVNRGMKTLGVRMEAHNRNAATIAKYLSNHPKISRVNYPTLTSHPDFAVGDKLFHKGFGGVLSFELRGDGDEWSVETFEASGRFVDALRIPYIGPSLGGCETIVEQVCILGYFDQPLRERKRLGVSNGLIRYSCGIEDTDDLINDIEAALEAV